MSEEQSFDQVLTELFQDVLKKLLSEVHVPSCIVPVPDDNDGYVLMNVLVRKETAELLAAFGGIRNLPPQVAARSILDVFAAYIRRSTANHNTRSVSGGLRERDSDSPADACAVSPATKVHDAR